MLRTDNTIECWSNPSRDYTDNPNELIESQLMDAPAGRYTAITAGFAFSEGDYGSGWCLLRTDGTLESWGGSGCGQNAPDRQFTAVAGGTAHWCTLHTDSTIECWGNNESGQTDAPDGQYTAVSAGGWHSSALRADGTITIWGIEPLIYCCA